MTTDMVQEDELDQSGVPLFPSGHSNSEIARMFVQSLMERSTWLAVSTLHVLKSNASS